MSELLTFGSGWVDFMLPAAIRALLLTTLTAAVVYTLRGQAARLRSLLWTAGLTGALLTPFIIVQPFSFDIDVPMLPAAAQQETTVQTLPAHAHSQRPKGARSTKAGADQSAANAPVGLKVSETPAGGSKPAPPGGPPRTIEASASPAAGPDTMLWIKGVVGLAWLGGTFMLLLYIGFGIFWQMWRSQQAQVIDNGPWFNDLRRLEVELNLWRKARLVRDVTGAGPYTWGVLTPTIALPADDELTDLPSRQAVLRHELAHIVRFDALRLVAERLLTALYWWNPLCWLVARWAHLDREQACDDAVLLRGARPSAYANQLLLQACGTSHRRAGPEGASLLSRAVDGQLVRRIGRILDPHARRRAPSTLLLLALLAPLGLAAFSVSAVNVSLASDTASESRDIFSGDVAIDTDGATSNIVMRDDAGPLSAEISGQVRFAGDTEIVSMSADGLLTIKDERAAPPRQITVVRDGSGVRMTYLVDGVEQALNQDGRAWLDAALLDLMRRAGVNAGPRVKRILDRDGAAGIIAEVHEIPSEAVRVTYLSLAIGYPDVDPAGRARMLGLLEQAVESDVERGLLIMSIDANRLAGSPQTRDATLGAIDSVRGAPVEQRRALEHLLPAVERDAAGLAGLLEVAAGIDDDVELGQLLVVSAPAVAGAGAASFDVWLAASRTIGSDIERGNALRALLGQPTTSADLKIDVMASAATFQSDVEKAQFLVDVAPGYRGSAAERAAYLATTDTITSDFERNRARAAL